VSIATPTRPRRRLTPDARRAELLDAGERVFAAKPYEDVSIEDIAETAGVSKNLLYHYFAGKRELYLETIRSATEELLACTHADPELEPLERVRNSIDGYLDFAEAHATGSIQLLRGAGGDPEVLAIVADARRRFLDRTLESLPLPGPTPPPGLELVIYGWIAFIDQVSIAWLDRPTISRGDLGELLVHQFVSILAAAVGTDTLQPPPLGGNEQRAEGADGEHDSGDR
jgi:AcrR family transcriptional regulator